MSNDGNLEPSAALIAALGEIARLLESGDAQGAAEQMGALVGRFPSVSSGSLGPAGVATARQLLERCRVAEAGMRKHVVGEMGKVGKSRKAFVAYR